MKTSQATLDKIAEFEGGYKLKAYLDPAGIPTIGAGHTGGVKMGDTITLAQAKDIFARDIVKFENYVTATGLTLTQNQFDALVSFTFNCGQGNLAKLIKGRDYQQIADAILLYNKGKGTGKVLAGLTRRRKWEHDLFLSGASAPPTGNPYTVPTKTLRLGSKGNSVRWLQYELNRRGAGLVVDGIFGPKVEEAVKAYQKKQGLVVDGIVGARTRGELAAGK